MLITFWLLGKYETVAVLLEPTNFQAFLQIKLNLVCIIQVVVYLSVLYVQNVSFLS